MKYINSIFSALLLYGSTMYGYEQLWELVITDYYIFAELFVTYTRSLSHQHWLHVTSFAREFGPGDCLAEVELSDEEKEACADLLQIRSLQVLSRVVIIKHIKHGRNTIEQIHALNRYIPTSLINYIIFPSSVTH